MTDQSKDNALEANVESPNDNQEDVSHDTEPDKQEIVRNDKGQFVKGAPSPNPGGRIKGEKTFPSLLNRFLDVEDINAIDQKGLTEKEKLVIGWIQKAKVDEKAKVLESIVNRLEGTPVATQKLDVTAVKSPYETLFGSEEDEDEG